MVKMACLPNASAIVQHWRGCPNGDWAVHAAADPAIVARWPKPVLVNVGANKGYAAAEFLALYSQRSVNPRVWHARILDYARRGVRRHGFLSTQACGACGACRTWRPAAVPRRDGGRVELLELLDANRALLRNLTAATGIADVARVHDLAASNVTHKIYSKKGKAGVEFMSAQEATSEHPANLEAVALDDFFARESLGEVFFVAIDTEGSDALVLEGMRATLRAGRVGFLEFEVGRNKGYWRATSPDRRTIGATVGWLGDAGYRCFMEAGRNLAPIGGACWHEKFDAVGWANVLCARSGAEAELLDRVARREKLRGVKSR